MGPFSSFRGQPTTTRIIPAVGIAPGDGIQREVDGFPARHVGLLVKLPPLYRLLLARVVVPRTVVLFGHASSPVLWTAL